MSGESFGAMLRLHRLAAQLSQNTVAHVAGIDPAFVNRLEKGTQHRPSRQVTLRLAEVLQLDAADTDRFLFVAGLAPATDWQAAYDELEAAIRTVRRAANTIAGVSAPVRIRRRA